MASRHAGLLCKVGKCKCPDVDEALDVCRTETLRCNLMEVHHRVMMVGILREPRMRMLRLRFDLMFLAQLARCLVHQGMCILLLRRHHVVIATLSGVLLVLIFRLLAIHAIHALAAFLVVLRITIGLVVPWLAVAIVGLLLASSILILPVLIRLSLGGILAILALTILTLAISCLLSLWGVASLLRLWAVASTGCLSSSAIHS